MTTNTDNDSNEAILISISCLTYNHGPFIRKCLEGFINQKCNFNYEILIHDDASTDETIDVIREYEQKYPDLIKPIIQSENQYSKGVRGISFLYNFPRAKGKYIALCEGDDYWTDPLKLQKQVDFMQENPFCSLVFTGCEIHKSNSEKRTIQYKINHLIDVNEYLTNSYFMATASLLFKKEVVSEAKNEEWMSSSFAGDFILRYKALTIGEIGYVDSITAVYNKGTEGSWSNRKLTEAVIAKEYNDNILGLRFLTSHTDARKKNVKYKEKRLLENKLLKTAIMIGGLKGAFLLLSNFKTVSLKTFGYFVKGVIKR